MTPQPKQQQDRETVICRICGTVHELKPWQSEICKCGERAFTTVEIKAQIKDLEGKIKGLQVERLVRENELLARAFRRPYKPYVPPSPKLKLNKTKKSANLVNIDLADF